MITLLHGDDIVKSRTELMRYKDSAVGKEIRFLDGKTVSDSDVVQALSSSSLFGDDTVIIIERLFAGLGKKIKRITELGTLLQTHGEGKEIIVWEDKEIGKTVMTSLGKQAQIRAFKLPTILFQFLDSIEPQRQKTLLQLYRQTLIHEPAELIHALFVRRIKQLLVLKSGAQPPGMQPWQLTRLTNQGRAFTLERLILLYQELRVIEEKRNSGTALFDMKESTERILAEL